jgi:predicted HAD superfamily Cof-like phosphohydrolase
MQQKYRYPHHSEAVAQFTAARLGHPVPNQPRPMDETAVRKYIGLCVSELRELARTVTTSNAEAHKLVVECLGMDPAKIEHTFPDEVSLISSQIDSIVDLDYYSRDIANEHGFNVDWVFDEVHDANMRKKFPDGTFHTETIVGSNGNMRKVIKPPGWVGPDVDSVVRRMQTEGSQLQ